MDNRRDLVTVFMTAENETKLQAKLFELTLETAKANDIITIYPKGSNVIAWVRVEKKYIELGAGKTEEPTTKPVKKAKKKARKKKGKEWDSIPTINLAALTLRTKT